MTKIHMDNNIALFERDDTVNTICASESNKNDRVLSNFDKHDTEPKIQTVAKKELLDRLVSSLNRLYTMANETQPIPPAQKNALAYLVESEYEQDSVSGSIKLTELIKNIESVPPGKAKEGVASISYRLYQTIKTTYNLALMIMQQKAIAAKDSEVINIANQLFRVFNADSECMEYLHKNGFPINWGGIPKSFLPQWYLQE